MDHISHALQVCTSDYLAWKDELKNRQVKLDHARTRIAELEKELEILVKVAEEHNIGLPKEIPHSFQSQSGPAPAPPQ